MISNVVTDPSIHATCSNVMLLPTDILELILKKFCDCDTLGVFWKAVVVDKARQSVIAELLFRVCKERVTEISSVGGRHGIRLEIPDKNLVRGLEGDTCRTHQAIAESLTILQFCEELPDTIWCGHMEFKDPLLPDWSAETTKVLLRAERGSWTWEDAFSWNASFSHTIKLYSQMYNFVPVRPRGQLFGMNEEDRRILSEIARRLESRDQVMTLRFQNLDGFILRIVSPRQARQRLERFRGSPLADFDIASEGLVCSWEYTCERLISHREKLGSLSRILSNAKAQR